MKTVRPILLPDGAAVHYIWHLPNPVAEDVRDYIATLSDTARSIVALGWGVDMVVGHGAVVSDEHANILTGERWIPSIRGMGEGLRMPVKGTFDALIHRHECFLKRLDSATPPPPLSAYDKVEYRRAIDPQPRDVAAFSLLKPDASGLRPFNTAQMALTVAGMMRYATGLAAETAGWSKSEINTFILGHGESQNGGEHVSVGPQRLAYLPLPSIESRGEGKARVVGSVRRILLTTFAGGNRSKITWARRALPGQELVDETKKESVALLYLIPENEKVVQYYLRPAASWSTVTPVVLPGYDDPAHYRRRLKGGVSADEQKQLLNRLDHRIDGLLRKAISQAGFATDLADNAILEWRKVGFWAGTELADRYGAPQHLKRFSRFHVRVQWCDANGNPVKISGPICIGGGRFYGLGLFAAEGD
jgi:CRISPR-associated protein Csb2